ncbi:RNA polymerase subunit sigma-24 [Candidatus Wolfebacteria bacterium]|nr:MAG: RNA polymerase subunit sigma-24 [Candidatus Wolfebacteria bacterium]
MTTIYTNHTDDELIKLFQLEKNENVIGYLFIRHHKHIYGYIMNIVKNHNDTDDIYQEVFLKAYSAIQDGRYKFRNKFGPWIGTIAHNICMEFFRKNKKIPIIDITSDEIDFFDFIPAKEPTIEEMIIRCETKIKLNKMISLLPSNQAEVVRLRFENDMQFRDIAEYTESNINTTLGRQRYALHNLRKLMVA